jgi:hypothetical protein
MGAEDFAEEQQFTCPKCGSHLFGSAGSGSAQTRHCHGYAEGEGPTMGGASTVTVRLMAGVPL